MKYSTIFILYLLASCKSTNTSEVKRFFVPNHIELTQIKGANCAPGSHTTSEYKRKIARLFDTFSLKQVGQDKCQIQYRAVLKNDAIFTAHTRGGVELNCNESKECASSKVSVAYYINSRRLPTNTTIMFDSGTATESKVELQNGIASHTFYPKIVGNQTEGIDYTMDQTFALEAGTHNILVDFGLAINDSDTENSEHEHAIYTFDLSFSTATGGPGEANNCKTPSGKVIQNGDTYQNEVCSEQIMVLQTFKCIKGILQLTTRQGLAGKNC